MTRPLFLLVLAACSPFDQESWIEVHVSMDDALRRPAPVQFAFCTNAEVRGEGLIRAPDEVGDSATIPIPGTIVLRQASGAERGLCLFAQLSTTDAAAPPCRTCDGVRQISVATGCWATREAVLRVPAAPGGARYHVRFDPALRGADGLLDVGAERGDGGLEPVEECP